MRTEIQNMPYISHLITIPFFDGGGGENLDVRIINECCVPGRRRIHYPLCSRRTFELPAVLNS